ncbi:unnamed protein product [Cylindrotheca closterium]|uniref:Uncharacterized protein n=1 Tax=Cylindrotheca closterium TaxID=2856 RepID=A0AAD2G5Y7_9STRA|nr:unnamed protein product [Cylindrotheca closterium]
MGKSTRRQSTSMLPSNFNSGLSEQEITDDDIYAAFGVTDNSEQDLRLDSDTPRTKRNKKVKKRQSAPARRLSVYDILYEDEEQYEIPDSVFDVELSPQANDKKLKRPKSTGNPVEAKILSLDEEPSLFDLLISPRENKDKYGKKKKKLKSKELVADLGKATVDEEESPESPSEGLLVLNDVSVDARSISMTKRSKKNKKARSNSLLVIDLGNPPKPVAESSKMLSSSDSQLFLNDELLEISPTSKARRGKRPKKVKSKSLVADLGDSTTEEESTESSSCDYLPGPSDEPLRVRSRSVTKRDKRTKKVRSKSLAVDLGEPPMSVTESLNLLSASDSQLFLSDESLEISPSSTTKGNKKGRKIRSKSYHMDLGNLTAEGEESSELLCASDCVIPLNDELLEIKPSIMTMRDKKNQKVKSKSFMMDLGESDLKAKKRSKSRRKECAKYRSDRDGVDQEILPRRRCRSHSPHPRRSLIQWGEHQLHTIAESSESEESDDDRWSSHSNCDSPPHAPRKRRKRHKSCSPPLARSPNRLWLESFDATLDESGKSENKAKKRKNHKSKEKSIEKPIEKNEKPSPRLPVDSETPPTADETRKSNSKQSAKPIKSSKESKKESTKRDKRKSKRKESNRMSTTSLDSSVDDSLESSIDSIASSKGSKTEKKKSKSSRNSKLSSLNDSMEFTEAMAAAEEELMRATEEARQKTGQEIAKLRAGEEARKRAEQEAAAAKLRLQVAEVRRKVDEEECQKAKKEAQKQAEKDAMIRAQEEERRNAEREEERQRLRAGQERLQQERDELERLRKEEKARLEKERVELQCQKEEEAQRLAMERADLERHRYEEEERLHQEKVEHERQLRDEKARIKARQEAEKARLKAEKQERERLIKEDKLRLKAVKDERDRAAQEKKSRIKAEKDAEFARIKSKKDAEKARIKAEKEAEMATMKREKMEKERIAEEDKVRIKAEKDAEMRRQMELSERKAANEKPQKGLAKPDLVGRNYSIDSLFQGSIDNSLHAEAEAQRMIKDRERLKQEIANLERQKKAAAARLERRAQAMKNALKAAEAKTNAAELDLEIHSTQERPEEEEAARLELNVDDERRERAPSPVTGEEEKELSRKESSARKQEKGRRMEEKAADDYRLGKLDGRRSLTKNDRTFNSGWNKIVVSTKKKFTH